MTTPITTRKTVHLTGPQYETLVRLAGKLQADTGRVYSIPDAIWEAARRTEAELRGE